MTPMPRGRGRRGGRVVFTIAYASQLPQAAALMRSLEEQHPQIARIIVSADAAPPPGVETLHADRLGLKLIDNMRLWYTPQEFAAALKPAVLRALFRSAYAEAVYLAPGSVAPSGLQAAFAALPTHSLVLTPRLTHPSAEALAVLMTGVFDLGVLAIRQTEATDALLTWWSERCFLQCRDDPTRGLYLDQRWMDLAPGFVADFGLLRDPGLRLHGNAPAPHDGHRIFPDGRTIEPAMRRWLLRAIDEERLDPHTPLAIDSAFFDEPDETAEARGITMTRLMYQIWLDRPELAQVFDIYTPIGLDAYIDWFLRGEADVAPASLTAATALFEPVETDTTACAPPWNPVAAAGWDGPAASIEGWLDGDVEVQIGANRSLLPLQAALQWENRADLQAAFPLQSLDRLHEFIGWAVTSGCMEQVVDATLFSPAFCAQMAQAAPTRKGEVPVTAAMLATRGVPLRRDYLNGWEKFPADSKGRLAHALWVAFIAPKQFGWPAAMVEPLRRYFDQVSDIACGGFRFSRAAIALLDLRDDLRQGFPLEDPAARWRFLHWLTVEGLRELGLTLDEFDPRLRRHLAEPCASLPGDNQATEMVYRARADLQAAFDITIPPGRQALHAWAEKHFLQSYAEAPLGIVAAGSRARSAARFARQARIGLTGHWTGASGRGEDLRAAAAALDAVGFSDYLVIDRDSLRVFLPDGRMVAEDDAIHLVVNLVYMNADTAVDDWWKLRRRFVSAERSVGFWAWELERLPRFWRHAFAFYDEIWAATRFAEAAFAAESLRPVRLMPMAVSVPAEPPPPADGPTVFLVMFDFASFIARKNPQAALAAFRLAFPTGRERARLIIKTQNADRAPAEWRQFLGAHTDRRVELIDQTLPRSDVLALIGGCHAFVSLHRSEGFGRGLAEAMLLGKPVIATGYSGTADFVDPECGYVVGYTLRPVARGAYPGVEAQNWAEADIAEAAGFMRQVVRRPEEARTLGLRGRERVQGMYAPALVGQAMVSALGFAQPPRRKRRISDGGSDLR